MGAVRLKASVGMNDVNVGERSRAVASLHCAVSTKGSSLSLHTSPSVFWSHWKEDDCLGFAFVSHGSSYGWCLPSAEVAV